MRMLSVWSAVYRRPALVLFLRALSCFGELSAVAALALTSAQLLWQGRPLRTLVLLLILGCCFVFVSAWRARINAPRPYERYSIEGMPPRRRSGCSFPSRHAFSAFAIGVACFACHGWLACAVLLIAAAQCVARGLLGVHFVRDLLAGAAIGAVCGGLSLLCLLV